MKRIVIQVRTTLLDCPDDEPHERDHIDHRSFTIQDQKLITDGQWADRQGRLDVFSFMLAETLAQVAAQNRARFIDVEGDQL